MPSQEVLVELDVDLVEGLDRLATRLGTSRSELIRRGAMAVLDAHEHHIADAQLVNAYRNSPLSPALVRSAAALAARTAPGW